MTTTLTPTEIEIFHAGTIVQGGRLQTAGGRVFVVAAVRKTFAEAVKTAYKGVDRITFEGMQHLSDIASRSVSFATLHVDSR